MSTVKTKMGYCSMCAQNILHERRVFSTFWTVVDKITLQAGSLFRIGPWYCCQCGEKSISLNYCRRNAPTNRLANENDKYDAVRNYIRSDRSLLLHKQRSARFSQKFRDGIVERLTSGTASISQLCQELELSEIDLIRWIADLLHRRQTRIQELTEIINGFSNINSSFARIENSSAPDFVDDDLIEGQFTQPPNDS